MSKKFLSVVIPCFNEERNIRLGALENVYSYLTKQKYSWEVLLVDDGSTDDSPLLIKKFTINKPYFHFLRIKHQGKAGAVSKGVNHAKGSIIVFTDLDKAPPLNQIEKLLPFFKKGYHLVIGSRNERRRGAP